MQLSRTRTALVGLAAVGVLVLPGAAQAGGTTTDGAASARCAVQFQHAQRTDMTSFRDYDAEQFRAVHTEDSVSIFPTGERFEGIEEIMAALDAHFTDQQALWSWTESNRRVDGCRSAFIEYETVYEIPEIGYYSQAHTVVSYVYQGGRWLAVLDQGTLLELRLPE